MSKFIPITTLDSKQWTAAQAKRVWRINAAAIEYFANYPDKFDYRTQQGQDQFFAICQYFMVRPLVDEAAPHLPSATERLHRERMLEEYIASLRL